MRTEEDVRGAFRTVAAKAPDAQAVLAAVLAETERERPFRSRRGHWAILAPVTAAAVVIALAVSLSVVLGGTGNRPSRAAVAAGIKQSLPPYFLALHERPPKAFPSGAADVLVHSSLTGATLATVKPPEPYAGFIAVTGAADDRTFVLAAQRANGSGSYGPIAFFLGQLSSDGKHLTLKPLPIPSVLGHSARSGPAVGMSLVGLALSPDGSNLAMMITSGPGDDALVPVQLKLYSLRTGAVKVWQARGLNFYGYEVANAVSWSEPGEVSFTWAAADDNGSGALGAHFSVRLLPVSSGGGRLLADSRLVLSARQADGFGPLVQGIVTADGSAVVVVLERTRWSYVGPNAPSFAGSTVRIGIFSTASGKLIRVFPMPANTYPNLDWSNSSGSVIVVGPDPTGQSSPEVLYAFGNSARVPLVRVRQSDSYELQSAAF